MLSIMIFLTVYLALMCLVTGIGEILINLWIKAERRKNNRENNR